MPQHLPDFEMQLAWQLGSPLFGLLLKHYAPSDTYHIWKVGGGLRQLRLKQTLEMTLSRTSSQSASYVVPSHTAHLRPHLHPAHPAAGGQPAAGGRHADGPGREEARAHPALEARPLLPARQWRCAAAAGFCGSGAGEGARFSLPQSCQLASQRLAVRSSCSFK